MILLYHFGQGRYNFIIAGQPVILNIIDYALIRNEYKQAISLKNKLERTKNNAEK